MGHRRPNVLLVLMDDMGYGDMGCYGRTPVRTPEMDAIAARGVRFTAMYSGAPVCTPSRCGLMTGRYAQRVGLPRVLFPRDTVGLGPNERTIADCLRELGYATCGLGKWHLGCRPEHHPCRHGFDRFFGLLYSNDMEPLHLYSDEQRLDGPVDQASLTRRYTDEAITFMRQHRDEPFFVYLAHTMPHIPLHVEAEFRGRSAAGTYGDTVECIDAHLGRLVDEVRDLGLEEDTVLVVTSDNGPWFEGSTGGFRGRKFEVYEGGVRMPFVAQWPAAIPAGTVCSEPAVFMDLLPTLVGWAGGSPPRDRVIDGVDVGSLFVEPESSGRDGAGEGQRRAPHEAIYLYVGNSLNAVRSGRWKLHVARGAEGKDHKEMPQLFDLEADPQEAYNVANLHPDVVERLRTMMETFDAGIKAECPVAPTAP